MQWPEILRGGGRCVDLSQRDRTRAKKKPRLEAWTERTGSQGTHARGAMAARNFRAPGREEQGGQIPRFQPMAASPYSGSHRALSTVETIGRWNLPFEEWVVSHAKISTKPHKGAKLEDTLTFFHQLSTLVSSGTPLLQALKIATAQCESIKLREILGQIVSKVSSGSSFHSAAAAFPQVFEFQWVEAIRTGEVTRQDGLGAHRAQQADPRDPRDQAQGQRRPDVPRDPDLGGGDRRDPHALDGRADLRQDVQGHGRQASRPSPSSWSTLRITSSSTASMV